MSNLIANLDMIELILAHRLAIIQSATEMYEITNESISQKLAGLLRLQSW